MPDAKKHILLIGGGHAHVAVLADWIKHGLPAERATLLTPHPMLRYSGMVPGWIAGEHRADDGLVDLTALARRAGTELAFDRCCGLDLDRSTATTSSGETIQFDYASIDTGGVGRARDVVGDDPRLIDIRPIDVFVDRLASWRHTARGKAVRIAVVGGGAGGVELAFALRNTSGFDPRPDIVLATGDEGLLPGFADPVRERVLAETRDQEIRLIEGNARFEDGWLVAADRSIEPVDLVVAATGSAAPDWPGESGLACDADGFIAVDRHQRSTSHPNIFAVGDVAARQDRHIPHSGVHAVFAGPVLADNLRQVLAGKEPQRSYRRRWNNLYLLNTGNGSAIASYGPFAAQGPWVVQLKHWIDKRWIATYAELARGG
ncbi:FAD-dependent oxidoreductase [Erythrobacter rubeus]|uniref:FAD-dependent oxidoreductase n=1 Tax=Erythrobacter rubeus TaxID=2760803 RepID=A0ABR8KP92_9SPHN|nr:FAD-dependent oxidoreductase [Erythrobacter rubeus]MBD2841085.1 FAD-dependent oxidoreductase [Erythrobacter rubeus]